MGWAVIYKPQGWWLIGGSPDSWLHIKVSSVQLHLGAFLCSWSILVEAAIIHSQRLFRNV